MTSPNRHTPSVYKLHDRLGFRVSLLASVLRARLDEGLGNLDLTRLEWCVLASIGLEGITAPSEIAEHIGITRSTASRTFKQLRDRGFLTQSLSEVDGRSRSITLTEVGETRLQQARLVVEAHQDHFLQKLDPKSARQFFAALDVLLEGVNERFDDL